MRIEEENRDVLQNIEFCVAEAYRANPDMTDYSASLVYEALIDLYTAEKIGRQPRYWQPNAAEKEMFDDAKEMCEWRLGRVAKETADSEEEMRIPDPIDLDTLLLCLKRLRKSVQRWTKNSGSRGYLEFMSQFV